MDVPLVQPIQQPVNALASSNPYTQGLVGWWRMDRGYGSVVQDWSGQNNHGTMQNMDPATDWGSGEDEYALDFDGTDDCIEVNYPEFGREIGRSTIIAHIKTSATAKMALTGTANDGSTTALLLQLNTNRYGDNISDCLRVYIRDENDNALSCDAYDSGFNDGEWHDLAFAIEAAQNTIEIYVDGNSRPVNNRFNESPANFATFQYSIPVGAINARGAITNHMYEQIASCSFYNHVLSASAIKQLHHNPDLPLYDPSSETPPAAKQQEATYPDMADVGGMSSEIVSARAMRDDG